jgi:hypothetical protein
MRALGVRIGGQRSLRQLIGYSRNFDVTAFSFHAAYYLFSFLSLQHNK